jgi:hypothetical protein
MLKWDIPFDDSPKPVKAVKCELNPGVFNSTGKQTFQPSRIWVDDTMIAAVGILSTKMALAAILKVILVIMGEPNTKLRQCPLAMDKWSALIISENQLVLGLILNTRNMSAAITLQYFSETLKIITDSWHKGRRRFRVIKASKLVGKLACLGEGAPWSRYLISQLYSSITFALAQNKKVLESTSTEYQLPVESISSQKEKYQSIKDHGKLVQFALNKSARMVHHLSQEFNIFPSMREEINLFAQTLKPNSGVSWETAISLLIKHMPFAPTLGDA